MDEKPRNIKVELDVIVASTNSIISPPELILKVDYSEKSKGY